MRFNIPRDINRGGMFKEETVVTGKCIGTGTGKISTFDLQQTKTFESSSFSNRQHDCRACFLISKSVGQISDSLRQYRK